MISPDDFIRICQNAALRVEEALVSLIGTEYGAEALCMGADNTPTERLDKIAEDIIIDEFKKNRVSHYVLSEEAGMVDIGGDEGIVYLDPVDGSHNAGIGIPFYALSAALSDGDHVVVGYVRNLANHETFTAIRGHGAFIDGALIHAPSKSELNQSTICVHARPIDLKNLIDNGVVSKKTRILGAAALELCYVACGRIDCFLDLRGTLRVTDAAAAILVLEEAGCIVTQPNGDMLDFPNDVRYGRSLIGANKKLHSQILELLRLL